LGNWSEAAMGVEPLTSWAMGREAVSLFVMCSRPAKTAERISALFGFEDFCGRRNIASDGGPDLPRRGKGKLFDTAIGNVLWTLVANRFAIYDGDR